MMEKTTSDKRIVRTSPVEVSPMSTLPPGLDEGQYRLVDPDSRGFGGGVDGAPGDDDDVTAEPEPYALDTPEKVTVKSQTMRYGKDGKMLVDVVFSVSDVKGATGYEVRTALA